MQRLRVSDTKRHLVLEDGSPFFWMGDTAWELFHKLNREEAVTFLTNRADHGFNVIQAAALAEFDGVRTGNAYGHRPLLQDEMGCYDPTRIDDSGYWDHVDFIVQTAERLGLYIGFLPTWGDKYNVKWGKGPEIFTPKNAGHYGRWLGRRYKDQPNIVWIVGGDRPLENHQHEAVVDAMAAGLREGDDGRHLITFHPPGGCSSAKFVHEAEWLDFHMIQSGHGLEWANYKMVERDYALQPVRPTLDGEPRYEDHPINFKPENGFYTARDVRTALYWAVLAGGMGVTYGHHSIWSMTTEPGDYFIMNWREALDRPAAQQVKHLVNLLSSRPFLTGKPDQSLVLDNSDDEDHVQAMAGDGYALLYSPRGKSLRIQLGKITGDRVQYTWYSPRNGRTVPGGEATNHGVLSVQPPSQGPGEDWVMVIDDVEKSYREPGVTINA